MHPEPHVLTEAERKTDSRTLAGRRLKKKRMARALHLRELGLDLATIAVDVGTSPYGVSTMIWSAVGPRAVALTQRVAVDRHPANRGKGDPNDFKAFFLPNGRLITEPTLALITAECYGMVARGELEFVGFDPEYGDPMFQGNAKTAALAA